MFDMKYLHDLITPLSVEVKSSHIASRTSVDYSIWVDHRHNNKIKVAEKE